MGGISDASRRGYGLTLAMRTDARLEKTVRVLDNLFSPYLNNLQSALGKATERQAMLTDNLANVNTPGYKRKDIDFNIVLQQEMDGPEPALGMGGAAQL